MFGGRRIKRKIITWVLLLPILFGMVVLTLFGQVQAVTIGNVLDNTQPTAPGDMYRIPGLNRYRRGGEGSYVYTGINMPGITGTPITTGTSADWEGKKAESPTIITFPEKVSNSGSDPDPWFSINYVDKNDFIDFKSANQANNFYKTGESNYNQNNVQSLMTTGTLDATGTPGPVLKSGKSFDGGILQVTGNVPIKAQIAGSKTSVDSVLAGNWGVMVRVSLPPGIDAKSLGGAIDWGKSYFYLTLESIPFLGAKISNLNFPLQFDHHVYLDPSDKSIFYLKVKGIPFNINYDTKNAKMALQRGGADYLDYLHNVFLPDGKTLTNLDNLGNPITIGSGDDIQPNFVQQTGGKNFVWDPFRSLANGVLKDLMPDWLADFITGGLVPSLVYDVGNVGRTISLLNAANPSDNRPLVKLSWEGLLDPARWFQITIATPLVKALAGYFVNNGFEGSAHINFSFDMSKYSGDVDKTYQSITGGRLFPAPYADGLINKGDTMGGDLDNRRALGITLYGSNTLLDPYSVLAGKDRSKPNTDLLSQLKAGTSPMDYALIDRTKLDLGKTNPSQTDVREFPVYTNFTSWTAFVAPFDNSQTVDTLNSSGDPLGADMRARVATPDSYSDGILVNDGQAFSVNKDYNAADYAPKMADKILTQAGGITPQRYTQVYQYYDYSGDQPVPNPTRQYTTSDNKLAVQVLNDTNAPKDYFGRVTKGFPDNTWVYSGKYNYLPVAGTNVGLRQDIRPEMNLSGDQIYVLDKSQLINNKTLTEMFGTWRDKLTVGTDTMSITMYPLGSDTSLGNASSNQLVPSATLNDISLHLGDSVPYGFEGDPPYGDIKAGLTIPPMNSTDNGFYGIVNLKRNADVPINMNTANPLTLILDARSEDLASRANFLILLKDDTEGADWAATHQYAGTDNKTYFFYQNGDNVNVNGSVKNNGDVANQVFQIMIPRVAGVTSSKPTVQNTDGSDIPAANITPITPNNTDLDKYYQRWLVKMPSPVIKGQTFTFKYAYQAADITTMPASTTLQTVIGNQDGKVLARTGNLYLKRMKNIAIMQTPTLDFGEHPLPKTQQTYGLTDASKQNSQLIIQDNGQANGRDPLSWAVFGWMEAFGNSASGETHEDFQVDLGVPTMPPDYQYPEGDSLKNQLIANHTPKTMVADRVSMPLFKLDRLLESGTNAAPLTLTYPNAQLTVPASVKNSGRYSSTITYSVTDGLQ
ncbi:hypothetical protein FD09_GL001649 [Schleiferilactobacillus perolens DSM 12744]|uniref:Uncharacterized protein n=2 Tax=Schleiferilactobacillus perolens TaxID=100468 RepID=A0A0R1MVQ8_9LACO|nr:hypothetical protein FD09_GL001649 [Schleiferilactobacillus perolens DSM 12744]